MSLGEVLREKCGLRGLKHGCQQGGCGACSVQVDGQLVPACMLPMTRANQKSIENHRGSRPGRAASSNPRSICGVLRDSMRLLHRGNDNGDKSITGEQSLTVPRRGPGRPQRKRVPMHRLSANRGCRLGCSKKRALARTGRTSGVIPWNLL